MAVTAEQLARWLEEDGHAGCASDLLCAERRLQPEVAREAANCMEASPDAYHDGLYTGLITQLREWANEQEGKNAAD